MPTLVTSSADATMMPSFGVVSMTQTKDKQQQYSPVPIDIYSGLSP